MRRDEPLSERQRGLLDALSRNTLSRNQRCDLIRELCRLWLPKAWASEVKRLDRQEQADITALMIRLVKKSGSVADAKRDVAKCLRFPSVESMEQAIKRSRREARLLGGDKKPG